MSEQVLFGYWVTCLTLYRLQLYLSVYSLARFFFSFFLNSVQFSSLQLSQNCFFPALFFAMTHYDTKTDDQRRSTTQQQAGYF